MDDRRDEVAGDHEEHVNTDKAAMKTRHVQMKQNDWYDGEGAKSVYVGTVVDHINAHGIDWR